MSRLSTTHPTGVEILHYSDHAGDAIVIIPPGVIELGECVVTECVDGTTVVRVPASALAAYSWTAAVDAITSQIEELEPPDWTG